MLFAGVGTLRSQEEKIRQMLDKFGRELLRAIHGSPSMSDAVQRIRSEGFALHLALGCEQAPHEGPASGGKASWEKASQEKASQEKAPQTPAAPDTRPPSFRLNTEDVSFLKSIGIDPTRNARRRRKPV